MEQNIRITEPASSIRRMARMELRGRWKTAIFAYILFAFLISAPTALIELLFGGSVDIFATYALTARELRAQTMIMLYIAIIEGPLLLGLSVFTLSLIRGAKHGPGMILDGFNNFFRAFGLFLLFSIFVFLWSLLFVIPGIIASFAYSQAFLLLADNPRIGLRYALKESRALMIGNKWKLFCLGLSFFGWICLTALVFFIVMVPVAVFPVSLPGFSSAFSDYPVAVVSQVLSFIVYIVFAPVYMYMLTAQAIFHDILTGRRRLSPPRDGFNAAAVGAPGENDRDSGSE
ncbi:MAG: DUF975 family protein [Clostridiales Family XIII bacterium]|jgi:uncharacterized membrane protein|nr:DUF975 family protein [Clostridiales Family XIII bacterium]